MLIGMLPPVANAKDDAYILYSEDGEHVKKMKREFFTADIEQVGCDYWKEGSGEDLQNEGGKTEPWDVTVFDGCAGEIDQHNTWIDPRWTAGYANIESGTANLRSVKMKYMDENFYLYDAAKAKKYKHYGDFWICFKLRDSESEVNSDHFICGERAQIHPTYIADPSQTACRINSVNKIDGLPVSIQKYPGTGGGGAIVTPVLRYIGEIGSNVRDQNNNPLNYTDSHFYHPTGNNIVVATYNRYYGYGLGGVKQEGTVYPATINYRDWYLHDAVSYKTTPPLTQTNTYELKFDEEIKRLANMYYDMETEYDEPGTIPQVITWTDLDTSGAYHKLWKLGVGGTALTPPTQIKPAFYHILPVANTRLTQQSHTDHLTSINAPRGALRSIPVVGVESYNSPVYDGYMEQVNSGASLEYYLSVEDYYSYLEIYTYYKSLSKYPLQTSLGGINMVRGSAPYYYINDMESGFVTNNYLAMSRKGVEFSLWRRCDPSHTYYHGAITNVMTIGCENFMETNDVSEAEYQWICKYTKNTKSSDYDPLKPNEYWHTTTYGDNNLEIGKVRVNDTLTDYSYWPVQYCDYEKIGGTSFRFKNKFAATDDYIFDTNNTLNVVRNVPDPGTGAPYDIYSLHTLWKMNIRVNGTTRYSIDTTFNSTRPQIMELKFNPNGTTNYGFGNEIEIDTTNNTETIKGFRVDSNKVRYAGAKTIRENGIVMMDDTGHYQSIRLTNAESGSTYNVQGNTTAKFRPETLYYCTRNVENGQAINDLVNERVSPLYKSYKSVLLSDIAGWSSPYGAHDGDLYLVGTMDSNGYFSVVSNAYKNTTPRRNGFITQDLPSTEDGLYYIYLGKYVESHVASECVFDFAEFNPIYYYKEGGIRVYKYYEPRTVVNGFVYKTDSQASEVDVTDSNGRAYLRFDSTQFENQYNRSDGNLTLKIKQSVFDSLAPLDVLALTDDEAMLNIASSNTLTKVCDITGLRFQDNSTYYIDVNIIFRTTDGTPMTDGVFEARLSYWYDPSIDGWIDGTSGEPVGYYKKRKSFIDGESELVIKMKGYINNGMARGGQYPYLLVRHSCSTNIDVGYSITGYFVKK